MAHEVESMMYYGEVPWHGLGTRLENPATAVEAIVAAGLDWQVATEPMILKTGWPVEGYQAIVKDTIHKVLGVVKERYVPIQNKDAFNFFDSVVGEGQAIYHTAGSLREGRRIFILAKLPESLSIKGDRVDKYTLLSSSHDGTVALQMFWTPIRVVCMNTLSMAFASAGERFYTRHTQNFKARADLAREFLGFANKFYEKWGEKAVYLASQPMTGKELDFFIQDMFLPKRLLADGVYIQDKEKKLILADDLYKTTEYAMATVKRLAEGAGKGLDTPGIQGTKWGAYNAVAEFTDYWRKPKGNKVDARLNSAWFGSGANLKEKAWDLLLKS